MPARLATRCALIFSVLVAVLFPLALFGILWLAKVFDQRNQFPRQATPVAVPVLAGNVSAGSVTDTQSVPMTRAPIPSSNAKSALVGSQIAEMVARSQRQSADENISKLDTMSKQLNSVASDESVDDLANNVQRWMGLESRASQSKAVTKIAEFDIDSAQLHDVQRNERVPGKFEYTAVLIDARGSTLDIKMTEAEGRETYALMRRIKANPLLEKIYRRIAMPLLDNLVQSARDQVKSPPPPARK